MDCLFHYIIIFIGIKHGTTSKVSTRLCHLYIHIQWKEREKKTTLEKNWNKITTILVAEDKILAAINICDYKLQLP